MEITYLSKHGFETVDSKIAGYIYPSTSVKRVTIHQFLHDSEGMARLVFAREAAEASFRQAVRNIKATDCENLQELGNVKENNIYLVMKEELMRGVDYRASNDTKGIALLIMSQFENEKTYKQGLGRVGRYDEQYLRCLWNETGDPVDTDKRCAYLSRLREASKPVGVSSTTIAATNCSAGTTARRTRF